MKKILLVDDHEMVRNGLKLLLETGNVPLHIEEAATAREALAHVRDSSWDAVILDASLPDQSGLELLKRIKSEHPELPVLMLSMHAENILGSRALRAGASGYLCKGSASTNLLEAVKVLLNGQRYVSPELGQALASEILDGSEGTQHHLLSDREFEVFKQVVSGAPVSDIAKRLMISPKTVHTYRRRILQKLGLKNNAELIHYAYRSGVAEKH
jgi:two-component system invasion response regulator UvrY